MGLIMGCVARLLGFLVAGRGFRRREKERKKKTLNPGTMTNYELCLTLYRYDTRPKLILLGPSPVCFVQMQT